MENNSLQDNSFLDITVSQCSTILDSNDEKILVEFLPHIIIVSHAPSSSRPLSSATKLILDKNIIHKKSENLKSNTKFKINAREIHSLIERVTNDIKTNNDALNQSVIEITKDSAILKEFADQLDSEFQNENNDEKKKDDSNEMTAQFRLESKTNKETYKEITITHNYMNELRILCCFCLVYKDIPKHEDRLKSLFEKIDIISNDAKKEMTTNFKLFLSIFIFKVSEVVAEHQRQSMVTFYEFQLSYLAYENKEMEEIANNIKYNEEITFGNFLFDPLKNIILKLKSIKKRELIKEFSERNKNSKAKYEDAGNYLYYARKLISKENLKEIQSDTHTESFMIGEILKKNNNESLYSETPPSIYNLEISESCQLYEILKEVLNSTDIADNLALVLEINSSKPPCSNCKTSLLWINEIIKKLIKEKFKELAELPFEFRFIYKREMEEANTLNDNSSSSISKIEYININPKKSKKDNISFEASLTFKSGKEIDKYVDQKFQKLFDPKKLSGLYEKLSSLIYKHYEEIKVNNTK